MKVYFGIPEPSKWFIIQEKVTIASWVGDMFQGILVRRHVLNPPPEKELHPGRLTWNLKTTQLKRKIIFQTIIFKFHVDLPGCRSHMFFFGWPKSGSSTKFSGDIHFFHKQSKTTITTTILQQPTTNKNQQQQ